MSNAETDNDHNRVVHNYMDRATESDPAPEVDEKGQTNGTNLDHNFPMKVRTTCVCTLGVFPCRSCLAS